MEALENLGHPCSIEDSVIETERHIIGPAAAGAAIIGQRRLIAAWEVNMGDTAEQSPDIRFRWIMPSDTSLSEAEEIAEAIRDQGGDAEVEGGRGFGGELDPATVILGLLTLPVFLERMRNVFAQKGYGVHIDNRTQPATITSVRNIAAGACLIVNPDGSTIYIPPGPEATAAIEAFRTRAR